MTSSPSVVLPVSSLPPPISPLLCPPPPVHLQSPRPLPPPRPPLVSKPPPPQSTGTINGGASLSQPPQLPVSPKHTFSSTSLFPFLGSSHPPQDNKCCHLKSRALRKHKSKTSWAQTISQYVLPNPTHDLPTCFTKFCRKLFVNGDNYHLYYLQNILFAIANIANRDN